LYNDYIGEVIEATIFSIAKEQGISVSRLEENLGMYNAKVDMSSRDSNVIQRLLYLNKDRFGRSMAVFKVTINRISFSESFFQPEYLKTIRS
jgi:hypothetical protein